MRYGSSYGRQCGSRAVTKLKMAEKSWRPFFGSSGQELPGETCRMIFVLGRRHTIGSIAGQLKGFGLIFFKLRGEVDSEWVFADGSYFRAHQHASGARRGEERAIGISRGGPTTKIHIAADAHGNPIDFEITGGKSTTPKRLLTSSRSSVKRKIS